MSSKVNELEIIRRLQHAQIGQNELLAIFQEHQDSYRVLLHLIQHPHFPAHHALNIISKLYLSDLMAVIKNQRTNPFVRKRSELELKIRCGRAPLGEKVALLKTAPRSLLVQFVDENHPMILEAILTNPNCTEDLVLSFLNRSQDRTRVYEALDLTQWHTNSSVATAVVHDPEAPIKMILKIIPYAGLSTLQRMVADENCHLVVRQRIIQYLQNRPRSQEE